MRLAHDLHRSPSWVVVDGRDLFHCDVFETLRRTLGLGVEVAVLAGDDQVPAVEAVLAAVADEIPGQPVALAGRVGVQVRASPAVDAGDDRFDLHGRTLPAGPLLEPGDALREPLSEDDLAAEPVLV